MKKIKTIRINTMFILSVVFIFLCIIFKLVWVGTGNIEVNGRALSAFADDRDTVKRITTAARGTIYSSNKEILAKNVNSYTVILEKGDYIKEVIGSRTEREISGKIMLAANGIDINFSNCSISDFIFVISDLIPLRLL